MNARYVRFLQDYTRATASNSYSRWGELEVYASADGTGTNLAAGKTVTTNCTDYLSPNDLTIPTNGNLTDGITGRIDGAKDYMEVDLGASYDVNSATVIPYQSSDTGMIGFEIQLSDDGTNYTTVYDANYMGHEEVPGAGYTFIFNYGPPQYIMPNDVDPFGDGSLLAKWLFDNTLTDTVQGWTMSDSSADAPASYTTGKFNQGLVTDYRIGAAYTGAGMADKEDFAMACFFSRGTTTHTEGLILSNFFEDGTGSSGARYCIKVDNSGYVYAFYKLGDWSEDTIDSNGNSSGNNNSVFVKTQNAPLPPNTSSFVHVGATFFRHDTGTKAWLFVDGVEVGYVVSSNPVNRGTLSYGFAAGVRYESSFCVSGVDNGVIDVVEFYTRGLTPAEWAVLAAQTTTVPAATFDDKHSIGLLHDIFIDKHTVRDWQMSRLDDTHDVEGSPTYKTVTRTTT